MYVNVPWVNTTYSQATANTLGLVKIGYSASGKNYAVQLDSNGKMYVNVPWTDNNTTYSEATSTTYGLVKIGYTTSGKNYAVQLSNGQMYVNVPWTDNNTNTAHSHSVGAGLTISGSGGTSGTTTYSANLVTIASLGTIGSTSKLYAVGVDANGRLCVSVPWTDDDTWQANTSSQNGYVTSGSGQVNKVWKTDANGNPAWRDDANTDTNYYHTPSYSAGLVIATSADVNSLYVPYAGSTQTGVVSTAAQTFAGAKTFSGAMTVNNTITFGANDGYGIRTATNNYCRIGESNKKFYEAYVSSYYGSDLGSSSSKFLRAYIANIGDSSNPCTGVYATTFYGTNLGSSSSKFSQAYITNVGDSSYPCTGVYATTFYASSDIRKKKNIFEYNSDGDILTLPIYKFDYKDGTGINQIGCMAQDLQKICPELVEADADGYLSIKENRLVYILLDRMKKMQKEIDELKEECQNG
jgi:hypothetical protein